MSKIKRVVFRIQLTPSAKQTLTGISDQLGIPQVHISSRLVEWFAAQPDTVRAGILGLYPDLIKKDVARIILENMASS